MKGLNRRTFLRLAGVGILGLSLERLNFSVTQAQRRSISWAKTSDLPGGHVTALVISPSNPDVIYLTSNVNAMGVWKSTNAGEDWERVLYDPEDPSVHVHATHTLALAIHPSDPRTVYVTDLHGRIIMTADGGRSWNVRYEGRSPINAIAVSPSNPDVLYAGTQDSEVLKSVDGGRSWTKVGTAGFGGIGSLAVNLRDPSILYVGTRGGIYKSVDGGSSWKQVGPANAISLSINPLDPNMLFAATNRGIFKSVNAGGSWEAKNIGLTELDVHSIVIAPSNTQVIYAGTRSGVFKSINGGESWEKISEGLTFTDIGPVAIDPRDEKTAYCATNIWQWVPFHSHPFPANTRGEGIYKTTNGGVNWMKKDKGFVDTDVNSIALDPSDPNVVYVGTECSRGIYKTTDGGSAWSLIPGGPSEMFHVAHYTMMITVGLKKPHPVYLTGRFGVIKSLDGGQSWQNLSHVRHYHGIAIDPTNPEVVYIGTSPKQDPIERDVYPGAHILKTTNGGRTWEEKCDGFPHGTDTSIRTFAIDPSNPKVVYVGTSTYEEHLPRTSTTVGIYKTVNGGDAWFEVNRGLFSREVLAIEIDPSRTNVLYAGTAQGVFKSSDGGASWSLTILSGVMVRSLAIDPEDTRVIYAGTDKGLYLSEDGSSSWQIVGSIPLNQVKALTIDPKGDVIYAAVNDRGVFKGVSQG